MMQKEMDIPVAINIDANLNENVVGLLDETNFMYLGKKFCQRDELFLFAMALGWHADLAFSGKSSNVSFVRTSSFSPRMKNLVDLVHFAQGGFSSPNDLCNRRSAYHLAEQYANSGLNLIKGEMEENGDSEMFANALVKDMDDLYKKLLA